MGRIGLDPSKSVGTAFELEGYPTLVILDGKGTVQSVHVGFNPEAAEPLSKTLAKEIDALARRQVAGKPQRTRGGRLEKSRPIQAVTANVRWCAENIDSCRTWKGDAKIDRVPFF